MSWIPSGRTINTRRSLRAPELAVLAGQARKKSLTVEIRSTIRGGNGQNEKGPACAERIGRSFRVRREGWRGARAHFIPSPLPLAENHHTGGTGPPEPHESLLVQGTFPLSRCRKQCNYGIAAGRSTLARDVPSSSQQPVPIEPCRKLRPERKPSVFVQVRRDFNARIVFSSSSRGR